MAIAAFIDVLPRARLQSKGSVFTSRGSRFVCRRVVRPTHRRTPAILTNRKNLKLMHQQFNTLSDAQKTAWGDWAWFNWWIPGMLDRDRLFDRMGYCIVNHRQRLAGDPPIVAPPGAQPIAGATITNLTRIDANTVRVVFNPSPVGANNRIHVKQTLPTTGYRKHGMREAYICGISAKNITSPHDFTTHFQHLAGWHSRYFVITQDITGSFSAETIFDL